MRIIVVDDNSKLAASISAGLRQRDMEVDVASLGGTAIDHAKRSAFDVIVLDIVLPDRDGLDVCRSLRSAGVSARILMLTALDKTVQKVQGLECGADDYMTKPFEFEELVARIHALARRPAALAGPVLTCGDLQLDLYARTASRSDRSFALSSREFALLEFLLRNQERDVTRAEIQSRVWHEDETAASNVVDVYVSALRKKIDLGHDSPLLHTVKGVGYRFGTPTNL